MAINFGCSLHNLRKILKNSNFKKSRLEQPFYRMNYAAAITALETYLSDAFFDSVINSDEKLNKMFLSDPEFKLKKFSIEEIIVWEKTYRDKASEHLQKIVWHNLARVSNLYKNVLQIEIPVDDDYIHKEISIRHDIVHRNGRTKNGKSIIIQESDIDTLLSKISDYVSLIDKQLTKRT